MQKMEQRSDETEGHQAEGPEPERQENGDGADAPRVVARAVMSAPVVRAEVAVTAEISMTAEVAVAAVRVRSGHDELEQEHPEPEDQRGEIDGAHEDDATMRSM